jgi:dihydrodipicolinate synthase/N-acetylneuraminate lyase
VKTALELAGVAAANFRLPMVPATEQERGVVRAALEQVGGIVAGDAGGR